MSPDELMSVLSRRRDAILLKLENKGLRIAPDPSPVVQQDQSEVED
jgi:hypothetical protein